MTLIAGMKPSPRGCKHQLGLGPFPWGFFLVVLLAGFSSSAPSVLAMVGMQPFDGQGVAPEGPPRPVWVTAFLDKLLQVDEQFYRFDAVLWLRFTWTDPTAWATVLRRSNETFGSNAGSSCGRVCTPGMALCCDNIWLPSTYILNVHEFPQGRGDTEYIDVGEREGVGWTMQVHGLFYSPMRFKSFPLDEQYLVVRLARPAADHYYKVSAHGPRLGQNHPLVGQLSKADDVSGWEVESMEVQVYNGTTEFATKFGTPSALDDPLPLSASSPNSTIGGGQGEGGHVLVSLHVKRLSNYYVVSLVVPVVLIVTFSWMVFSLDPSRIDTRMQVSVTLFLALTAFYITISASLPSSSYITCMQRAIVSSYIFILCSALESIVVYIIYREGVRARAWSHPQATEQFLGFMEEGEELPLEFSREQGPPPSVPNSGPLIPHSGNIIPKSGPLLPFSSLILPKSGQVGATDHIRERHGGASPATFAPTNGVRSTERKVDHPLFTHYANDDMESNGGDSESEAKSTVPSLQPRQSSLRKLARSVTTKVGRRVSSVRVLATNPSKGAQAICLIDRIALAVFPIAYLIVLLVIFL